MDPAQHIFVWIRAELCIGTSLSADPKFSDQCSPTSVYAPAPLCPRTTPTFWIPLLPPLHTHTPNSFSHPPHCHLPNALVLMLCWRSLEIFGHRGSSECANEQRGHAVRSPRGAASLQSARPGERLGCCKVQPGAGQIRCSMVETWRSSGSTRRSRPRREQREAPVLTEDRVRISPWLRCPQPFRGHQHAAAARFKSQRKCGRRRSRRGTTKTSSSSRGQLLHLALL